MTIHLARRSSREGWTSFETDDGLRRTKERLRARCLPCLTGLLEQLKTGGDQVEVTYAWDCWKVVALTRSREECLEVLTRFSQAHPEESCYGKFGKGGGGHETFAVMFHTESEGRRDELLALLQGVVEQTLPGARVFFSRGCGDPYEFLLGPWQHWQRVTRIPDLSRVAPVKSRLRESLYGSR